MILPNLPYDFEAGGASRIQSHRVEVSHVL